MEQRPAFTDQQVEQFLGNLLRFGVVLAAVVVLIGGILYLAEHGNERPQTRKFHGEPPELTSVAGIMEQTMTLDSLGIMQFGLLLLVATPVVRVVFSIIAFASQRDITYVVFTVIVLAVLIFSLLGGGF